MAHPATPPTKKLGSSDNWGTPPSADDFEESPVNKPKEATTPRTPLSPASVNTRRALPGAGPSRTSKKRARSFDTKEEVEDGDEEETGAPDESDPRRRLRCSSTGKLLYKEPVEEGSPCPSNVAKKLQLLANRGPVGIVNILAATSERPGGLAAALRRAEGLRGLKVLIKNLGGDLSINLLNQGGAEVLEATIGECNNGDDSFHQPGADVKTAKLHRASQAALKLSTAGRSVVETNINSGGCAAHVDGACRKHCALLPDYSPELQEAMENTTLVVYEKVAESCQGAKVLLVLKFGNFKWRKHRGRDGTPVVTKEVVTEGGMVVLSAVSKHLSLAPGDTAALLSIVEARAALRAAGARALEWRKGELDLKGLLDDRTDADRREAVLDFLQILVTAQQEPVEYRESPNEEKTQEMVQMIEALRKEESLAAVLAGVEEISTLWGPRGYTTKNRSDGGQESHRKRKAEDADKYSKDQAAAGKIGGAVQSGEQEKPNSNPRGPGGAGDEEFDYGPYRRSIGSHFRGQKTKKDKLVKLVRSKNKSEFFEFRIPSVNKGEWKLGTQPFDSNGDNARSSYPCGEDGVRIETAAKVERGNIYLMMKAREHGNAQG